jgi:hypothetical protein
MIGGAWLMKRKEMVGKKGEIGCVSQEEGEAKRNNMRSDTSFCPELLCNKYQLSLEGAPVLLVFISYSLKQLYGFKLFLWDVNPYVLIAGYQCFVPTYYSHLQAKSCSCA